jgi:hypothetical protein
MLRCACGEEDPRPIAFQRSNDEEEEERCGEEAENVGEGPNEEQPEAKLEHVSRQTHRSHVVAPPIAPAREDDRVLIRPVGNR